MPLIPPDPAELALPTRQPKPRHQGITSMIDFGPDTFGWSGGETGIRNLLEVAADFIDSAKIFAMNALLIPAPMVKRVASLYRDAGIKPFAGGILFEYAWQRNQIDELVRLLRQLGIPALEISENYITLTDDERRRMIDLFQNQGIAIVYEFGRKNPEQPIGMDELAGLVHSIGEQGIRHMTVEQCEIDLMVAHDPGAMKTLADQPWFSSIVIEVDPYRFPEQHAKLIHDFGPDVNLANVTPGQIMRVENFRRGLGRAVNFSIVSGDSSRPAGAARNPA
ncbi:MAG: phosphosulfolactate synthase [Burkholderiales bacterium]